MKFIVEIVGHTKDGAERILGHVKIDEPPERASTKALLLLPSWRNRGATGVRIHRVQRSGNAAFRRQHRTALGPITYSAIDDEISRF